MPVRSQSGIELVTTYGIMLLVVMEALLAVFLLSGTTQNSIPSVCFIYGSLKCNDMTFGGNGMGGSELRMLATMSVPGVINFISFNGMVGGIKSTGGYCTTDGMLSGTNSVSEGQQFLCVTNFPYNILVSQTYSGTFNITANYCPTITHGAVCNQTEGSTYRFTGSWRSTGIGNAN